MPQCQGTRTDGKRCENRIPTGQNYCWRHGPKLLRLVRWFQRNGIIVFILAVIGLLADVLGIVSFFPKPPDRMPGSFGIAIAGFSQGDGLRNSEVGTDLSLGLTTQLEQTIDQLELKFTTTVWGPNRISSVEGQDKETRARNAAQIADDIGAEIIVYGMISTENGKLRIEPEFYVPANSFIQASEITGQHNLGSPFTVSGQGDTVSILESSQEMAARIQALTDISVGLMYYLNRDYENSLILLKGAEEISEWKDSEGRHVLYMLIGNAAGKAGDFEMAKRYYEKAIKINPEYARGYLGLADVSYRNSLIPFEESNDPTDIDLGLLMQAIALYQRAAVASEQPPLTDISTKVDFGLGQCLLAEAYAKQSTNFDLAASRFEAVIDNYGDGANPRIRELAAESHARLGLIYDLSGLVEDAVQQYTTAASLLKDNPDRQALYEERAEALKTPKYYHE